MLSSNDASAADRSWIDPGGGAFATAGNWSPATVPGLVDDAHFTLNNAYTVSFSSSVVNHLVRLAQGTVTFDIGPRTYATTATGLPTDPSITVGAGSSFVPRHAHLILSSGTLSGVNAMLGVGPTGSLGFPTDGNISVNAGARLNLSGGAIVGWENQGVISVAGGGDGSFSGGMTIGYGSLATGQLNISGAGSTVTAQFITAGLSGDGAVSVTADGDLTTTLETYIGRFTGSTGNVTVSGPGSSWTNSGTGMFIGFQSAGSLTVSDGALVTSPMPRIGDGSTSTGNALVTGAGSRWIASGTAGKIGNLGHGALTISGGGTASFGSVEIGSEAGSVGSVSVSGNGSRWTSTNVSVGKTGTGHVNITAGGVVQASNFVRLGGGIFTTGTGSGFMTIDGAGSRYDGGLYVEESSSLTVSNAGHANLSFVESTGTVTLTGGTGSFGTVTGQFGAHGSGRINVNAAGSFTAQSIKHSVLNITGGGRATVRLDGTDAGVSVLQNLAIGGSPGAWTGTLDLTDNDLIIDYDLTTPLLAVADQIRTAYNGGAWNGNGITSTSANANNVALGYAESSSIFATFPATFSGQQVDDTAVLVKFTRYGDANLDGTVNLADFNALAANFGQSNRFWRQGDFNYDGTINLQDFNKLAANFGLGAAGPQLTPQDWARLGAAVPEPSAVLGLMSSALLVRRVRRASGRARVSLE
jgi:T5SS/PEP-CTERM-associated repeat protein